LYRNMSKHDKKITYILYTSTLITIYYLSKIEYCLTSVEQHQAATYILVALERCCSSEVIFNGQCYCAGEIFLPVERGSRLLEVPL